MSRNSCSFLVAVAGSGFDCSERLRLLCGCGCFVAAPAGWLWVFHFPWILALRWLYFLRDLACCSVAGPARWLWLLSGAAVSWL